MAVCRNACARALIFLLERLSVRARMGIAWVVLMHVYLSLHSCISTVHVADRALAN